MERREDDSDMSSIAMPGFIDILSTVIIMFVFFVTVIAIMLYVHTVKFKAAVVEESQQQISQEMQDVIEKIKNGEIDITKLQELEKLDELKQVRAEYASSKSLQKTTENQQDKTLVIFFDKSAISIGEETEAVIQGFIQKFAQSGDINNIKVQISAGVNPLAPTITNGRQISLARMLNARNILLKNKVPQSNIQVSYAGPEMIDNEYGWVRVVIQ